MNLTRGRATSVYSDFLPFGIPPSPLLMESNFSISLLAADVSFLCSSDARTGLEALRGGLSIASRTLYRSYSRSVLSRNLSHSCSGSSSHTNGRSFLQSLDGLRDACLEERVCEVLLRRVALQTGLVPLASLESDVLAVLELTQDQQMRLPEVETAHATVELRLADDDGSGSSVDDVAIAVVGWLVAALSWSGWSSIESTCATSAQRLTRVDAGGCLADFGRCRDCANRGRSCRSRCRLDGLFRDDLLEDASAERWLTCDVQDAVIVDLDVDGRVVRARRGEFLAHAHLLRAAKELRQHSFPLSFHEDAHLSEALARLLLRERRSASGSSVRVSNEALKEQPL